MLYFLPTPVKGVLAFLLYALNTILLTVPLILASLLKFVIPGRRFNVFITRFLMAIAFAWIEVNRFNNRLFCQINWDVRGLDVLEKKEWYLVLSNHQSWVDILVLQTLFNGKIPMLKFFLKKELIWVPFLGLAWWALDFPFMKRYSRKELDASPNLKGKDLESTRKACEKFKFTPVSVINFVEGTRLTPEKMKKALQKTDPSQAGPPLAHLLPPKAGGIAFVLGSMGEMLHQLIDVTIVYPDGIPTFWSFISGKTRRVTVDIDVFPITEDLKGDYFNDPVYRDRFFNWINRFWQEKDEKIARIRSAL